MLLGHQTGLNRIRSDGPPYAKIKNAAYSAAFFVQRINRRAKLRTFFSTSYRLSSEVIAN